MKNKYLRAFFCTISLAIPAFFAACGEGNDLPEFTEDMQVLWNAEKGFSKDSVIYLADSVKFVDKLFQSAEFGVKETPFVDYKAKAMASAINIGLYVAPNSDGGSVQIVCHPNQTRFDIYDVEKNPKIIFEEPRFPAKNKEGYSLKFMDSLRVIDSTFYDILYFSVPDSGMNLCNISAFYYGIHDGVVRVVSRNGVELNRVSAQVYENAEDRRAEERALADSIAQAVADSIAQAVADSIIKANTPSEKDSTDDNAEIEIPQEIVDLADSVANCIKKAYSEGSLSAIKNCKI